MNYNEAIEWMRGTRSMMNIVPREPFETWQARIAEADAAMKHQAYWTLKAQAECLVPSSQEPKNQAQSEAAFKEGYEAGYHQGGDDCASYNFGVAKNKNSRKANKDTAWKESNTRREGGF